MDVNFNVAFASNATKSSISEETWELGWVEVVGGINGVPTAQQFNEVCYVIDVKANLAYKKAHEAMALATKTSESLFDYAPKDHAHSIEDIEDFPESLPANGGTSEIANLQTVHYLGMGIDILAYAVGDTCPAMNTKVRIMNSPTCPTNYGYDGANNDFWYDIYKLDSKYITIKAYDIHGNVEFINSCLNGSWSGWFRCNDGGNAATVNGRTVESNVPTGAKFTDTTYSAGGGISISGTTINNSGVRSVSSGSSNGTIKANINGTETDVSVKGLASAAYQAVQTVASTVGLHRISSGSDEATTANCPAGCWYGQYE